MTRKFTFLILAMLFAILGPGTKAWGQRTSAFVELCTSWNQALAYTEEYTQDYTIDDLNGGTTTMTIGVKGVYRQGANNTYFQMNKKEGYFKNTTKLPGKITKIETTWSAAKGPTKCYFATDAEASSSDKTVTVTAATSVTYTPPTDADYYFFNIDVSTGSGSAQMTSCKVYYEGGDTPTLELISVAVSGTPTKTTYEAGEEFDPAGLTVTGTYSDASTAEITSGITWNVTPNPLTAGTTSVSVTATVSGITSSAYIVNGLTVTEFVQTYANTYTSNVELSTEGGTSASAAKVKWDNVEYNALKCGTSSVAGACVVTIPANTQTLHFHAAGWKGDAVVLNETFNLVADGGVTGSSPFTLQNDPETSDYFTLDPQGATSITFTATTGKRFVLFGVNAEEASSTDPVINAENVELAYDATSGAIPYSITNPIDGQNLTAELTEVDWISNLTVDAENNQVTFDATVNTGAARTATITLKYTGATGKVVTVTQKKFSVDYATLPFSYNGGQGNLPDGLTQNGLGSDYSSSPKLKFDGEGDYLILKINENPGTLTFDIKGNPSSGTTISGTFTVQASIDGEEYTDVASYSDFGNTISTKTITDLASDVRYIKWIYTNKEEGNVALGNIQLEKPVELYTITIYPSSFSDVTTSPADRAAAGTEVTINISNIEEHYHVSEIWVYDAFDNKVEVDNYGKFIMPESDVSISVTFVPDQQFFVTYYCNSYFDTWEEIYEGPIGELREPGWSIPEGFTFAGWSPSMSSTTPITETYNVTENTILFAIFARVESGVTKYYTRVYNDSPTIETATVITDPSVIPSGATLTVYGLTNPNAENLVIDDGGQLVMYNSETDGPVLATVRKNITGYGIGNEQTRDGYYLIANPTASAANDEYDAFDVDECAQFDLYTFNPAAALEWVNIGTTSQRVTFERNVGYLFASANNTTMNFRGSLLPADETTEITLVKAEAGPGIDFPGFNLIGNPFACNAYVGKPFYVIQGAELTLSENAYVAPCEGFFVEAAEDDLSVTLSTTAPEAPASLLNITVSQNRGNVIDRAIVRFDGANNLHKFMMDPAHTNLSIAKGGETFAAISTEAEGELPVNFKAEKNGTYTITVNTENVEANYLHLIDNMTGMDTDLLSTPSYTFDAKTSDYASRFKLVFGMKDDTSAGSVSESFAYISNGEIVISNEGRATLQVIDVMGRIVSNQQIEGDARNSTEDLTAGVYVLNLNGNVQKIVVK